MESAGRDIEDVKRRIRQVIAASKGVPDRDLASVGDLVEVGETQVALENLCTQIFEYGVALNDATLRMIRELAADIRPDDKYWQLLESEG